MLDVERSIDSSVNSAYPAPEERVATHRRHQRSLCRAVLEEAGGEPVRIPARSWQHAAILPFPCRMTLLAQWLVAPAVRGGSGLCIPIQYSHITVVDKADIEITHAHV